MRAITKALGSALRGVYVGADSDADAALKASIEKLNRISFAMIEEDKRSRSIEADEAAKNR